MPEPVIVYAGFNDRLDPALVHSFVPVFDVQLDGQVVFKVWVELTARGAGTLMHNLERLGIQSASVGGAIQRILLQYGVRRLEQVVRDAALNDYNFTEGSQVWKLNSDDVPQLLPIIERKRCEYQERDGRDYFCRVPASSDKKARTLPDGRFLAPTSVPLCKLCDLPSTDYLCSAFSHPEITSVNVGRGDVGQQVPVPLYREVKSALCNEGRAEISHPGFCHAGGHACWRRVVEVDETVAEPHAAPGDVPDALDTLAGYWQMTFGKNRRLISFHTISSAAELGLGCATRSDFKSRMTALTDVFDKLKVGDDLLPENLPKEHLNRSMNRLESCLKYKLPEEFLGPALQAIRTLRQVRRVRDRLPHTGGDSGLSVELAKLGIMDAPPNWSGAWDRIRAITADSVHTIRRELARWKASQEE